MPWTHFECPDGDTIRIENCLTKCRMLMGRCVSRATLSLMAKGRREWDGRLSATQALNGTRLEFLRLTHEFAEAPCSRAFALLGTLHHLTLQDVTLENAIFEQKLEDDLGYGTFDLLDQETHELNDFKTAGAYKVNRLLGKIQTEIETGEIFKSGVRAGQKKTRKEWSLGAPDNFDYRMQVSRYCWMLRDKGYRVDRCLLQVTVRDFTAQTSRSYGLDRQVYLIEIVPFDREVVVAYYQAKGEALRHAMATGEMPPICSAEERWDDRRCQAYCPVWMHCEHGRQARATPLPEEGAA